MKKIILLCAGGMSTSILVGKMKEAAEKLNIECEIAAYAAESIATTGKDADCILLGPQVTHKLEELKEFVSCPIAGIDMMVYGMMDGEAAFKQVLELIGE